MPLTIRDANVANVHLYKKKNRCFNLRELEHCRVTVGIIGIKNFTNLYFSDYIHVSYTNVSEFHKQNIVDIFLKQILAVMKEEK